MSACLDCWYIVGVGRICLDHKLSRQVNPEGAFFDNLSYQLLKDAENTELQAIFERRQSVLALLNGESVSKDFAVVVPTEDETYGDVYDVTAEFVSSYVNGEFLHRAVFVRTA